MHVRVSAATVLVWAMVPAATANVVTSAAEDLAVDDPEVVASEEEDLAEEDSEWEDPENS